MRAEITERIYFAWVAMWVVVLLYVAVWLGMVFGWRWWKRRVMEREANVEHRTLNSEG
ncbi:hypothetical protein [Luteolibacter soli]